MIKCTFQKNLGAVKRFTDEDLSLSLSAVGLRNTTQMSPQISLLDKLENFTQNIENTIFYIDNNPDNCSMLLRITRHYKGKNSELIYGIRLKANGTEKTDLFIDTISEAQKKGIIKPLKGSGRKAKILGAILGGILIIGIAITMFPIAAAVFLLSVLTSPINYLIKKNRFKDNQKVMHEVVEQYENKFELTKKTETKDWITFWGRVKSNIREELSELT